MHERNGRIKAAIRGKTQSNTWIVTWAQEVQQNRADTNKYDKYEA